MVFTTKKSAQYPRYKTIWRSVSPKPLVAIPIAFVLGSLSSIAPETASQTVTAGPLVQANTYTSSTAQQKTTSLVSCRSSYIPPLSTTLNDK